MEINVETPFRPQDLQISLRTYIPLSLSERLNVAVVYLETGAAFLLTLTGKNTPPIVQYRFDDALLNDVGFFNQRLFGYSHGSVWNPVHNRFRVSNKLVVSVDQPTPSNQPSLVQKLLTKSDTSNGTNWARPLWHRVGNQWEAPFFYSDEVGVFLVSGDERWRFDLKRKHPAFYGPEELKLDVHIPDLEEVPEDPLRPGINSGGDLLSRASSNVRVILGGTTPFDHDGSRIGSNGVIADTTRRG